MNKKLFENYLAFRRRPAPHDSRPLSKHNGQGTATRRLVPLAFLALVLLFPTACNRKEERMIQEGSVVDLQFTLSDTQGDVIQSTEGHGPFTYTHGQGQLIPALEKQLTGMKVGDEKNITLEPGQAYGDVDPNAFREIPRDQIPAEGLKVGAVLAGKDPEGNPFQVRVHEIKKDTVVMDFNHPLAGKALVFDITVVDIK